ncbi:MAG: L-erythro-3,5-diaminohexanoate dehydrogenase, partial [Myxococcales bacterium]
MPDPYGLRRVVRPKGVLPQQAEALDPGLVLGDDELLIDVEHLNIDAASFRQLWSAAQKDPQVLTGLVTEIVRNRGKMHNPVTGSGGMLIGRVSRIGPGHPAASELKPGERIATLV